MGYTSTQNKGSEQHSSTSGSTRIRNERGEGEGVVWHSLGQRYEGMGIRRLRGRCNGNTLCGVFRHCTMEMG